jgi:hypothetical protein
MAQTGFTPIRLYSSTTAASVPSASNISNSAEGSEIAINVADGKLFYKDGSNVIQVIATKDTTAGTFTSLGVGTAASGTTGEIRATNNVTAYYSSDRKFKENVVPVSNALDKVQAIGTKTFDWTDEYIASKGGEDGYFIKKNDFGVIAQDVQAVFPEAVRSREDGSLAVDYEKLGTLAFQAIIELSARVKALEVK